ncbi:MAG: eukaryotic-like serine/threonine-protein kinase [Thermoleophilaceae bacterium]|nr:eukaryotic-like serine/threonine-protein kinase [Thermoleophilaceae bacterium]
MAGDTLGTYTIESELGEGGMGRVYKAAGADGQPVAIKIVKGEMAGDEIFLKRFKREAEIAQRIKHPNVVSVIETGDFDGLPWAAQAFISGGSLEQRLDRWGALDLHQVIALFNQVAGGLDVLHENGLIHRDLKPGNILVDDRGKPFIADFGLAKDHQNEGTVLTRPGQALGSMDYMAPEQIRGEDVGATTDVYALACMLTELLTGQPPFADKVGMRIMWAHLQDPPPHPSDMKPTLPRPVGDAILKGLEKDPADRPQSATEFMRGVEIAAGPPASPDDNTVVPPPSSS